MCSFQTNGLPWSKGTGGFDDKTQIASFCLIRARYIRLFWLDVLALPAASLSGLAFCHLILVPHPCFGCIPSPDSVVCSRLDAQKADSASICPWLTIAAFGTVFLGTHEEHAVFCGFVHVSVHPCCSFRNVRSEDRLPGRLAQSHHVASHEALCTCRLMLRSHSGVFGNLYRHLGHHQT
jgi:hypothetical protein